MKAVPIDRSGPPMCPTELHQHYPACSKCGRRDQTVSETKPVNGIPWPAMCEACTAKNLRIRAVVKAVAALEAGCD